MPEASVHICLNKKRKQLISLVEEELKKDRQCSVYGLKPVYPLSFEEVLIPTILGRDFPYGYNAANMGVLVLDVQAILHTYEAVALGKPLIERVVALGGTGFSRPTYITIRIGTSVGEVIAGRLVEGEKHRLLFDSINTGETIKDPAAPVNRTVSSIIAIPEGEKGEVLAFAQPGFNKDSVSNTFFSNILPVKKKYNTNLHGEKRACISCSFCINVCPVGIYPNLLFKYAERDIIDEYLTRYKIFNCIECNLCTYVCPSKIPVSSLIKEGKRKLEREGINADEAVLSRFNLKGRDR